MWSDFVRLWLRYRILMPYIHNTHPHTHTHLMLRIIYCIMLVVLMRITKKRVFIVIVIGLIIFLFLLWWRWWWLRRSIAAREINCKQCATVKLLIWNHIFLYYVFLFYLRSSHSLFISNWIRDVMSSFLFIDFNFTKCMYFHLMSP